MVYRYMWLKQLLIFNIKFHDFCLSFFLFLNEAQCAMITICIFPIPISLHPNGVNLWFFKVYLVDKIYILKCQKSTAWGSKDIGSRKLKFAVPYFLKLFLIWNKTILMLVSRFKKNVWKLHEQWRNPIRFLSRHVKR